MTIPAGTMVPRDARDFGQYELLAKIATGGMAEIFLARPINHPDGKLLVLKRILPHLAEDDHFVTMFRDEADLASKLVHPNVCKVHALGHHAGSWFIAMEYLHGVPLSRIMTRLSKQARTLDTRIVTGIVFAACEGLHHAHELRDKNGALLNVVHRDVSPPNIMVVDSGLVKLLDFGIAKASTTMAKTRTGTVKGKNAYMSPEQIMGKALDRRSDIFALGTVMYELLTIKRLFHRDSDFLTFKAISEEPIPDIMQKRPDLPTGLRSVLLQALARDPAGRFATAKEFGDAIRGAMMSVGGPATTSELAMFLSQDFGDELAAHEEILHAADQDLLEDEEVSPQASSTNRVASSPGQSLRPAQGEFANSQRSRRTSSSASVPSMVVSPGTGRFPTAPAVPSLPPTPPAVMPAPPLPSGASGGTPDKMRPPTNPAFPALAETPAAGIPVPISHSPSQAHSAPMISGPLMQATSPPFSLGEESISLKAKNNTLRNAAIALVLIGVGGLGAVLALSGGKKDTANNANNGSGSALVMTTIDAAPATDTPPDADGMSRVDIAAMAKFGFLSIASEPKAKLFLNDKLIGDLPIDRLPVAPGPYKAKVVQPNGKTKKFEITIYGGKDTELGTIDWTAK